MGRRVDGTRVQGAGREPSTLRRDSPAGRLGTPRAKSERLRRVRGATKGERLAITTASKGEHRVRDRAAVPKRAHAAAAHRHRRELHRQRARHSAQRAADVRIERAQLRIRRRLAHTQSEPSLSSPVMPAAGSACPMFALMPPTPAPPHEPTAPHATSEPASIGSPSAVPVPCASCSARAVDGSPRILQRGDEQALLRLAVGRRQARRPPVLTHRAAKQAERRASFTTTQRDAAARLATRVPVRARVERVRAAARRRHPRHAKLVPTPGASISVTPATSPLALGELQRAQPRVARRERRRARRVVRDAWPVQPERVREPPRRDRRGRARRGVHAASRR